MDVRTENWSGTGLIIRQKSPNNLEMPFDQLGDFITPAELFYVRSHFPTPELDPNAYRLSIGGAVHNELKLSYADIRAMPSRTCVATLECAGNSRVFLVPPVPGAQWELGAVGNANGRVFLSPCCWSTPDWRTEPANWCSKALIAVSRARSQGRRAGSRTPVVSQGSARCSRTS